MQDCQPNLNNFYVGFMNFFSDQPLIGHMQIKNSMYTYIKLLIYSVPFVTWSETCGHSHMFSERTIQLILFVYFVAVYGGNEPPRTNIEETAPPE